MIPARDERDLHMKYVLSYLILFFSFNVYAITVEAEMHAVMDQSANTWNRGDLNTFLIIYKKSDDTRYISTNIITGYENISKRYFETYSNHQKMGKLAFTIDDVKKLSDQYRFVIGKYHLARNNLPDANGVFTLLFEKVGNDWKVIVDHTSATGP